jgi:Tol biopolymer transport system component
MPVDDPLGPLAEAVADGRAVEWDAQRESVGHADIDSVAELQVLAEIARLHREAHTGSIAEEDTRPASEPPRPVPELFQWGPLSVREQIGGGSFGDVYRAWDPSLQREVALKLFRGGSADALAREGQLLARVRHPNVMAVYGAQEFDGRTGMWSELLRGRTLADIVRHDGMMSAAEAIVYVDDVCRALAAVHGAGLIHRDIKAQNVMREIGGRIVLMDLGLGRKADEQLAAGFDLAGTPLYLAPELFAKGGATAQSDIYSVGVLMFFLVTGQYPVAAGSVQELAEAHRTGKRRRLIDLRPDLPASFIGVVERALMPEAAARFESAGALQQAVLRSAGGPAASPSRAVERLPARKSLAAIVAAAMVAGVAAGWGMRTDRSAAPDPIAFNMPTPDGLVLTEGDRNVPVVSPDGRQIAFVGTDRVHGGVSRLYLWSLSQPAPRAIAGSENAANPFWAPDSHSLAFVTARGSALYRVSVSGARSERLADLWESRGGAWGADGSLLIARQTSAIYRLDASGSNPRAVTSLQSGEIAHMWPQFLPDGRRFIFFVQGRDDRAQGIYLGSVDGGPHKKLVFAESSAIYANGYLLFPSSGALFAQRLDVGGGVLVGPTVRVVSRVDATTAMRTIVSTSDNGTLVYAQGKDVRRLTWYDLRGNVTATGDTASLKNPALSRDRALLAIEWYGDWRTDPDSNPFVSRGRELRVLSLPEYRSVTKIGGAGATCPVWGPNGQLAFVDVQSGQHLDVYVADIAANTLPRLLVTSDADKETTDWSRDGRLIAYHELRQSNSGKVYRALLIKPLDGPPYPAVTLPDGVSAHTGTFSPDGRFIAYMSDVSGGVDWEIYIRDLKSGAVRQVSRHGGYSPIWRSADALLFLDPQGRMFEGSVPAGTAAPLAEPRFLFATQVSTPRTSLRYFDFAPDSQQIVVASPLSSVFSVIVNWPAQLRQTS